MLRVLHTSDWHLGRQLYGQNRHDEFEAFLNWLQHTMHTHKTDVLLIAGDVFDTTTPNHAAQTLYYRFLSHISSHKLCQHVIIIGGNHDSASFLNAPQSLLSALNVHVIGGATENLQEQIITITDDKQQTQAIICAAPYLRDRDVRLSLEGQSQSDKQQALMMGIKKHYQTLYQLADQMRQDLPNSNIPIIAMGHLFTQGGVTLASDGVRELYVGTLAHVGSDVFDGYDYVALGHLHVPQTVNGLAHIRYCGSPIAMGFSEAHQQKLVVNIEFTGRLMAIDCINVPVFHALERLQGNLSQLKQQLHDLMAWNKAVYVEVTYQGDELVSDLNQQLQDMVKDSLVSILRVYNRVLVNQMLPHDTQTHALPDLTVEEVFEACLQQHGFAPDEQANLRQSHQQVLEQLQQQGIDV